MIPDDEDSDWDDAFDDDDGADCECEDCVFQEDNPTDEDLDNLATLAGYLRTVPVEQFDYEKWGESGHACGTVACALGHAVLGPFNDRGYTLEPVYSMHGGDNKRVMVFRKDGLSVDPTDVINDLFGDGREANQLFYPNFGCPRNDPSYVADRIDDYVDDYR